MNHHGRRSLHRARGPCIPSKKRGQDRFPPRVKSNEPAVRRDRGSQGAQNTRHAWLAADKDLPFHPRRRERRLAAKESETKRFSVHRSRVFSRCVHMYPGILVKAETRWKRDPLECKYPRSPDGIVFNYCLLSGRCYERSCFAPYCSPGGG